MIGVPRKLASRAPSSISLVDLRSNIVFTHLFKKALELDGRRDSAVA